MTAVPNQKPGEDTDFTGPRQGIPLVGIPSGFSMRAWLPAEKRLVRLAPGCLGGSRNMKSLRSWSFPTGSGTYGGG